MDRDVVPIFSWGAVVTQQNIPGVDDDVLDECGKAFLLLRHLLLDQELLIQRHELEHLIPHALLHRRHLRRRSAEHTLDELLGHRFEDVGLALRAEEGQGQQVGV